MALTAKVLIYCALMAVGIAILSFLYIRDSRKAKREAQSNAQNKDLSP